MNGMQRWVIHIDMDAFFASVEQLCRPTLRGRPVLVGGLSGRGVVAGASYEARALGAHSAMPMFRAQQLIGPRGVVVRPRFPVYQVASRRVFDLLAREVDVIEQLSIDECFMEPQALVGATHAEVQQWCMRMREKIREVTGLPSSMGAGPGKQCAKIASGLAKPDGVKVIEAREFVTVIHPLPVGKLWGAGPVTQAKLAQQGIETIGQLAALSEKEVDIALGGSVGRALWLMARGVDDRAVAPRAIAKQISVEQTFSHDLSSDAQVAQALGAVARRAHARLLKDGRAARTVTVKLKFADFHVESRSATLHYATDDVETLTSAAYRLVRLPSQVGPVRLVGVSFSGLEFERQDVLFPELDRGEFRLDTTASAADAAAGSEHEADDGQLPRAVWEPSQDVFHPQHGHGWVQGTGHGVVSVRFETRATGPGITKSLAVDDPQLSPADPLESLAWEPEILEQFRD